MKGTVEKHATAKNVGIKEKRVGKSKPIMQHFSYFLNIYTLQGSSNFLQNFEKNV